MKKKKGISLIVLVITIIIIIILTGTVILNLVDNNPIDNAVKAKEALEDKNAIQVIETYKLQLDMDTNKTLKDKLVEDGNVDEKELEEKGIYSLTNNVIVVSNFEGLKEISRKVENGMDYTDKYVYVVNDIDCNATFDIETGELLSGENFTPIGDSNCRIEDELNEGSKITIFNGIFDGGDYTISNLYIKDNDSEDFCTGLFGYVGSAGIVKNVVIDNSYIQGYYEIGAIAGRNRGQIINCINKSTVVGDYHLAGGIAGRNTNVIENCTNYGNIIGVDGTFTEQIGGIVGNCDFGENVIVKKCINYGKIDAMNSMRVAGIVGIAWSENTQILNCENRGQIIGNLMVGGIAGNTKCSVISNCSNYGKVEVYGYKGAGIAGVCESSTVLKCRNLGDIYMKSDKQACLAGIVADFEAYITDSRAELCYNEGTLYGNGYQFSGIVGNADTGVSKYSVYILNCYNKGNIENNTYGSAGIANYCRNVYIDNCYNIGEFGFGGGIIYNLVSNVNLNNNYWLSTCGANNGIYTPALNDGTERKSEDEIKKLASILGDAYETSPSINDGYPYLKENKPIK